MANSLIATLEGLEKIDRARKRMGWNKTAKVWLSSAGEISKSTLDRFWSQKPIRHDNFVAICQSVGVDWESVADLDKEEPSPNILLSPSFQVNRELEPLATQMRGWFEALRYEFEPHSRYTDIDFEWLIRIPARRGFDRVVVQGINDEIGLNHLPGLREAVVRQNADEGWLVTSYRISPSVQEELRVSNSSSYKLFCFTFDELIDQDADFKPYMQWLEQEVKEMKIDRYYIHLSCTKEELDPITKRPIDSPNPNDYDDIDKYINEWLVRDRQEHISIIGEFGTGKTWFSFHYAWECLKRYREAIARGFKRPRLPLLITLRDYSRAISVENVLADFFYSQHNIRLNSGVFDMLNKMGKILMIFDGFDEMAIKNNLQIITNNFAELAKVVVPGSKVILTSRIECFPSADFRLQIFSGQIPASTSSSQSIMPLQFETLKLKLLNEKKVRQLLSFYTSTNTVNRIVNNSHLLDLFKRPIMTDLILAALPEIEKGGTTDLELARVYLYAVKNKMDREIRMERTFTSLADKLYFMCEISWEMLSTDRLSLNYLQFPEQLKKMFGNKVLESPNLDHWHYDMMRTAILVRDFDGNYAPAHRSLLEFFVAYKFAAELGLLTDDFISIAQSRSDGDVDRSKSAKIYKWSEYWQRDSEESNQMEPLERFERESAENLRNTFGKFPLTLFSQIIIDILINITSPCLNQELLEFVRNTKKQRSLGLDFTSGNIVTILINCQRDILKEKDLERAVLRGADLESAYLINTDLTGANLAEVVFAKYLGEPVYTAAFSPDTKWLVTGSEDGMIRLWDTESWQEKFVLEKAHSRCHITVLTWSPDGNKIVSGDEDGKLKVWDVNLQQGNIAEKFVELGNHGDRIRAITWSPNGKYLASGGRDNKIKIWDARDVGLVKTLIGHKNTIRSIACNPDNNQIATGSRDKTIKIWDAETGNLIRTLVGHENWVRSVLWNGNCIISSSDDNTIVIWDSQTGNSIRVLQGHDDIVRTIALSPDRQKLVSGSDDTTLKVWEITTGRCLMTCVDHKDSIKTVAWSPDGHWLYSSSSDKTVKLWNAETGKCEFILQDSWGSIGTRGSVESSGYNSIESCNFTIFGDEATIKSVAWSPDGHKIVTGSRDKTLKIWDVETGKCLAILFGHTSTVRAVVWSPDGQRILSGSRDKTLKIWNAITYQEIRTIPASDEWIRAVAWSPDSTKVVSTGDDLTIKVWDAETSLLILTCSAHEKAVRAVAWSPDGTRLLSASDDKTLKIWDAQTGNLVQTLSGHKNWVRGSMWSPDGQKIVSSGRDRSIKIWDAVTGECLFTFEDADESALRSVAWSSEGNYIVSGSDYYTVKLWNWDERTKQLKFIQLLSEHKHFVTTVAWSPDSKRFASGSRDKTVKIWDWDAQTGKVECLHTLRNEMYAGMKIKDAIGLTPSQSENLKSLGAID
jgi:WD40 repeat protein